MPSRAPSRRPVSCGCRFRPFLESLEDRIVPRVNFFANLDLDNDGNFDDFRIVGDKRATRVTIVEDPAAGGLTISIDANGNGNFGQVGFGDFPPTFFGGIQSSVIDISLGSGNDFVDIRVEGDFAGQSRMYLFNASKGNDRFSFDMQGHAVTSSAHLSFEFAGFGGSDRVETLFNDISDSFVALNVSGGGGPDDVALDFTGTIDDGAVVEAEVVLGSGNNKFFLNLEGVGSDSSHGVFRVNVLGGRHFDNLQVEFGGPVGNGTIPSFLEFVASLDEGNDFLFLDLRDEFAVRSNSAVQITAYGGGGNDLLDIDDDFMGAANNLVIEANALLAIDFFGDAGNDTLDIVLDQPLNPSTVTLLGNLHVRSQGSSGNDTMSLNLGNDNLSSGNYDVALYGASGNDSVQFNLEANGAAVTFSPLALVLLDGGPGKDTLANGNLAVTHVRFFP
jgi:hypothetical protein